MTATAGAWRSAPASAQRVLRRFDPTLAARVTERWKRWRGEPSLSLIAQVVREGDVALDIGANWGLHTNLLADLVGTEGHVHAFEPHPHEWRCLDSIERRRSNVTVHPLALSDRTGPGHLRFPVVDGREITALASLSVACWDGHAEHRDVAVSTARLDDLMHHPRRGPSFIKCDVEGHELAVLRGGELLLERCMPSLLVEIEERHRKGSVHETCEYLTSLGYVGSYVSPAGLRPLAEFDLERDQLAVLGSRFAPYEMPSRYVNDFFFHAEARRASRM